MPDPTSLAPVVTYIATHRAMWTADQLRDRLLADGVAPDLVQAAMQEVYGAAEPITPPPFASDGLLSQNEEIETMVAYIRQHTETYEPAAIRARLLEATGSPDKVDLALAKVFGYTMPAHPYAWQSSPPFAPMKPMSIKATTAVAFALNMYMLYHMNVLNNSAWLSWSNADMRSMVGIFVVNAILATLFYRHQRITWIKGIAFGLLSALIVCAGLFLFNYAFSDGNTIF